jgi:hypothetical protein
MSESPKAALAASVAAGYLLGRRRNAKIAMTVAAYLASKKLRGKPQDLLAMGAGRLGNSPQVSQLVEQLRSEVLNVGRDALKALAEHRLGSFADSLADRTRSLNELVDAAGRAGEEDGERPRGEEEREEEEGEEEGRDEGGDEGGEESREDRGEGKAEGARERGGERPARPRRPSRGEARETGREQGPPAKKSTQRTAEKSANKAPPKKRSEKSAARKAPAESSRRRR